MLDILKQIQTAIDTGKVVSIYVGIDRFGYTRDGLNYPIGLHGFREWWAIEKCLQYLAGVKLIDYTHTGGMYEDTAHITPITKRKHRKNQ